MFCNVVINNLDDVFLIFFGILEKDYLKWKRVNRE